MTKHEYLILSIILVLFLCFAVYQWGDKAGETELVKAWNEGHAEGYRKAYCDGVDEISNIINYIKNKADIKSPQETPLLNKILKLKGD